MEQEEKGENRQIIPEDPRWNGELLCLSFCLPVSSKILTYRKTYLVLLYSIFIVVKIRIP